MAEGASTYDFWEKARLKQRYLTARFHAANGMTHQQIADVYGTTEQHVWDVLASEGLATRYQGDIAQFYKLVHDADEPVVGRAKSILQEVALKHDLTLLQLKAHRRHRRIIHARQEAMYRLYDETCMSLPRIAKFVGGFDHTTVLHGCRAHARRTGLPPVLNDRKVAA